MMKLMLLETNSRLQVWLTGAPVGDSGSSLAGQWGAKVLNTPSLIDIKEYDIFDQKW